jgi:hypothetical protein
MKIVIVWLDSKNAESVSALAWNGGAGPLRVYEKDNYDTRLALGKSDTLPLFTSATDAIIWMKANVGEPTQVSLPCAQVLGFSKQELGE